MKDNNLINVIIGAVGGLGTYLCGLNWEVIIIWIVLMILDILTGLIKSSKKGNFTSKEMKAGLFKKVGEFFLMFALILGQRVAMINGINVPIGSIFVGCFCIKELGSIIENSIQMDIQIPEVVSRWFKVAKDQIENSKESDKNV